MHLDEPEDLGAVSRRHGVAGLDDSPGADEGIKHLF